MTGLREVTQRLALGVFLVCCSIHTAQQASNRPHIIIIVADDLGWSDVGFRDGEMHTPNIDKLASEGMMLNYSYMQQVCTPSRAAFLTGVYPFRMGLQYSVFTALKNNSMPMDKKVLPEHLQSLGYKTHMVGKWHLGFCNYDMTPTHRGFDTFYGMYNGKAGYFNHSGNWNGYDLHDHTGPNPDTDWRVDWEANGTYSTHLFTEKALEILKNHEQSEPLFLFLSYQAVHSPLEAPKQYMDMCSKVTTGSKRKLHCAVTAAMDEGVGKVLRRADSLGYSENLITLFLSDNGGPISLGSSNWPLRGSKITLWEGGTRAVTILRSKKYLPDHASYVWNGLMHGVDWYPTLVSAADDGTAVQGIDGVDNWQQIIGKGDSKRNEFVYNIDDVKNTAALRYKQYKLVNNKPGKPDGWYNPPAGTAPKTQPRGKYPEFMLFDIENDPAEDTDIISKAENDDTLQQIVTTMKTRLAELKKEVVPFKAPNKVSAGKPSKHGGAWKSGWC